MPRALSIVLAAAISLATITTSSLLLESATAETGHRVSAGARPRPTPRPTTTPTPVQPTASSTPTVGSSPSSNPVGCPFPETVYNGATYCPATIRGVRGATYPTGVRVVLKGVTVTYDRAPDTVTVASWASDPCPPGKFCGATLTLESLTVPWGGTARPAYGDVLDLFGITTSGTVNPVGYIKTGYCPIDLC